jgi:hypothetical protein
MAPFRFNSRLGSIRQLRELALLVHPPAGMAMQLTTSCTS